MSMRIVLAEEDHEIQSCYHVMAELRPHLMADEFLPRVKRQAELADYKLAYVWDGEVKTNDK